jgi:glycosyltransferase involved in cell wall biosynthesis
MTQGREAPTVSEPLPGVNLVGYLHGELGLGEVARKLSTTLERAGVPFAAVPYRRTASRQHHPYEAASTVAPTYDTNIICLNADQLRVFVREVGVEFLSRRYSVGVWFWETSKFPDVNLDSFHFVDEVWVASEFVRAAVAPETWKPVLVVPLPIEPPAKPRFSRAELGLPEGFLFLFSFDFLSVFDRKNPLAVIEAFSRAFAPGEGPVLLIKSINGERKRAAQQRLRAAAAARPDIRVLDGYVSAEERNAITAACDCYVSLHRSEGLGLTMAEAMAFGRPVIATGYSGNLEFMNEDNSYLVPYRLVPIPPGAAYPEGGDWAEPDLEAAATLMRTVYARQDEARARGQLARTDILSRFTIERTANVVSERLVVTQQRLLSERSAAGDLKTPLLHMANEVAKGIGGDLRRSAAGSAPKALLRRLLLRALWPYLAHQHRLNIGVLDAIAVLQRSRLHDQQTSACVEGAASERSESPISANARD